MGSQREPQCFGIPLPRGGWVKLGGLPLLWVGVGAHVAILNAGRFLQPSCSRSGAPKAPFLWLKQASYPPLAWWGSFIAMGESQGGEEGPISSTPNKIETTK